MGRWQRWSLAWASICLACTERDGRTAATVPTRAEVSALASPSSGASALGTALTANPQPSAHPNTRRPISASATRGFGDASKGGLLNFEQLSLGGSSDTALPWIIALHGLGDTPRGFAQLFAGLALHAHVYLVQAPLPHGSGYDWFGVRVSGDPERLALAIGQRLQDLTALLDHLADESHNRGDAIVTGFSQGGILSFAIAAAGLRHVKATLPLAGWLPPSIAGTPPALPVYAFHGTEGRVVPFTATRSMLAGWQDPTLPMEFHTYPGVAHTISREMHHDWAATLTELTR